MDQQELKKFMSFKKKGEITAPLAVFEIDEEYILSVYRGTLSRFDLLVKYKQKIDGKWSRLRTPKHVHWTVDILIKLHENRNTTQGFLNFLVNIWDTTLPIRSVRQRNNTLNIDILLSDSQTIIEQYESLNNNGEYSIKFLIVLAKLLMIQEKTNKEDAFMFIKLLKNLQMNGDIFSAISSASHNGK